MDADDTLALIGSLRNERSSLMTQVARVDEDLRAAVGEAFDAGIHHSDIVKASGLSQARVYQIRKGTRR